MHEIPKRFLPICAAALLVAVVPVSAQSGGPEREVIELPAADTEGSVPLERTLSDRRSIRQYGAGALSLEEVGQLLWAAQGVTQQRTGYRTAPSAGATFPLEVYLVVGRVEGLSSGVYRYLPGRHEMERVGSEDLRQPLYDAALRQPMIRDAPVVLVIASVTERTQRRYGARAERYVAMEAGHASQNIYLQATAIGLGTVAVGAFDDGQISTVLGLDNREQPLYLMPVGRLE